MTPHGRNPIFQAAKVYQTEPCSRTFQEDLDLHLSTGFVHSTPDYFIMGRPVPRLAEASTIIDPAWHFTIEESDCWHIYLAAGNIQLFWLHEDSLLFPWVSWEKRNRLRIWPMSRVKKAIL